MNPVPIAVFASGAGSNLQAFIDVERSDSSWPARIAVVISDRPACMAISRAKSAGIDIFAARVRDFPDKASYEAKILSVLHAHQVRWLVLAGYMRIVGPELLRAFPSRIVNIHPSLLPAFPGKSAVEDAYAAKVDETGVTVHFVDEGVDTGPVIAQRRVAITPGMRIDQLFEQIHSVEHELYPETVRELLRNSAELSHEGD